MPSIRVPVEGTGVVHEGDGPSIGARPAPGEQATQGARGGAPEQAGAPGAQTAEYVPGQALKASYTPQTPARSTRFARPAEDSSSLELVFDKWGKAKYVPKEQAAAYAAEGAEGTDVGPDDAIDDADLDTAPAQVSQGAPTGDLATLQNHVAQLSRSVELLIQSQLQGKPIGELGKPAKPAPPTPPDAGRFDFNDPQDLAEFQRQNHVYMQSVVADAVSAALEPHREGMESARWQNQYNDVFTKHSKDPSFQPKMQAALDLVKKNPQKFTIPEAYDLVNSLHQALPQKAAPQGAQRPARTLSAGEAAAKREQARRLPARSGGASGPGRAALPSNVTKLGSIMAWHRQFRSQ